MDQGSLIKIRRGPDGIHLFDRKNGTNILLDAQIPHPSSWTACPRQVSIALTNTCDLKCAHCYAPKESARLHKDQIKRWMVELDHAGCFGIGFGGGEPTLHRDLVELCDFGHRETKLAITLTTHGHTLTEKLITQLENSVNFFRVSMDGVGVNYERIRGRSFENLIKNLKLLKGRIPFGINFVVNRITIGDLSVAIEVAKDCGAVELLLLPEEPIGLGKKIDSITLNELRAWIANYKGDVRLSISAGYKNMVDSLIALKNEPDHLAFAHIDANGILKRTSFEKEGCHIGEDGVLPALTKLWIKKEDEKV